MIRPLHGIVGDVLDMAFNIDGRLLHTLPPLFARPGWITVEYLAGRRTRYVAPFRLMFWLCVLAFFISALAFGDTAMFTKAPAADSATTSRRASDPLPSKAHTDASTTPAPARSASAMVAPSGPPQHDSSDALSRVITGRQPVPSIRWLPGIVNRQLQAMGTQLKANVSALEGDDEARQRQAMARIQSGVFSALPQTMIVLVPLFALLLKGVYLFRRRLYMEHLVVALHSHAFLFLCLLLGVGASMLSAWLVPHADWLGTPLTWVQWGLWLWAPLYLLLMQKRVYAQGWPMTLLKYAFVGWCYVWLLGLALAVAGLLGLAQ
ncbi:MAG: DUF3667 domain-containing protein [Rhodanobacter sp.]